MSDKVILATGNVGKVAEMQQILQSFGLNIVPQSEFDVPEAIEDGLSFVENALIKARNACKYTGLAAIADDSGIQVDALDGAPGIYSARYAAEAGKANKDTANNEKLLASMEGIESRSARFQCVIVYMTHATDPSPVICQGSWEGEISERPTGSNGFGYDPVFYVPELGLHSAELDSHTKKSVSHRAKALRQLQSYFRESDDTKA